MARPNMSMDSKRWPVLQGLCAQGVLETIDLLVAERLLAYASPSDEGAAATIATLMALMRQGHLCLNQTILPSLGFPQELVELVRTGIASIPKELIGDVDHNSSFPDKPICRFNHTLYFQKNWVFEASFVQQLKRLIKIKPSPSFSIVDPSLNLEQQEAIGRALSCPFSMIIGGPGTGKTYTAAHLVKAYLNHKTGARIVLAAPTGKAAARLGSSLAKLGIEGVGCKTVHALLGIRSSEEFSPGEAVIDADLIIVDECSMIDARLFSLLLSNVGKNAHLVLMGDPDQLPPIEAGSLFADLSDLSLDIPITCLKTCMRSERQELIALARAVKEGKIDAAQLSLHQIDLGLQTGQLDEFYVRLWDHIKSFFPALGMERPDPARLLEAFDQFRILCSLRQGPYGTEALNQRIFNRYLSEAREAHWWAVPILITRTDAERSIFNGDTAVLLKNLRNGQETAFFADGRSLPSNALNSFEAAYCLSIHKSQGSEYERVLVLLPEGSERFGKEVLYTAVTRARSEVFLDGSQETIFAALRRSSRKESNIKSKLFE